MHETKGKKGFSALLKDADGKVLAEGEATVFAESRAIEFTSDFVPMYRMGTQLQVARLFENKEIHLFRGKVFLSDKNLIRLVSITDRLLPGSENVYFSETKIPAVLKLVQRRQAPQPVKKHFWFRHRKKDAPAKQEVYEIIVSAISGRQMEFTSNQIFDIGDSFTVTLQLPQAIEDLPIFISQAFAFGKGCMYRCTFDKMESSLRMRLDQFVRQLNQQENSFFPKLPTETETHS